MSRALEQWEAYLSKAMPRVHLLSELGLNYEDMLEIANLIKGENARQKNVRQTTKVLVEDFPCTFVGFLAAFAAQNTEREFWDAVARLINVTGMELNNARWRNHFVEILKEYKKPIFEDLSFVYVANMRIHGGIPSYSLRDFFANMLMPSIENPEYIELKGKELLDALLSRSAVQMFTDSTVRNFFENTEDIGVQYLESCRQVAKSYNSSRQIPSLHGLPSYVVDKLVNFIEYQEDEKRGLRRPKIKFDPEGDGLLVELPEEPISGTDVRGGQVRWLVIQNQRTLHNLPARILRSGRDIHSEEQVLPLGFLIAPFQVTFSLLNQEGGFTQIREWNFDIRSQEVPDLLVFRSEDGSLVRWDQSLPAQDLLLVHPKDVSLEFDGDARLIHSPDMYAPGWQNWQAEYRALSHGTLSLVRNGEAFATVSIQKQLELPRLTGEVFQPNLDHKLLYLGGAPILRIPLRSGVDISDELKRWKIEINSAWEADPFIRQEFRVMDHFEFLDAEETALKLNLAAVLGDEPKGTYTLRVRGPRETDVEIPFRVWSSLQVEDLPEYILPVEDSKVVLHFSLPEPATLETQAGATGINITGQRGKFAVELDETVSELKLNLTWARDAAVIHVPVSIPVPRIKWRLVMGEESKVEWSNHSLRKPADSFLQSAQTPALLIQLPGIEDHNNLTLRLIDPEDPTRALQEFTAQASVLGSGHARFLLVAKDTINQNRDVSVFEFQLLLVNEKGLYQPVSLFSLTREIEVTNVRIEQTEDNFFLLWDESSPLKNRRVFIRSLWKPWADPWNVKIPDDARGKFDLLAAGYGLPPSWYEVHFYVTPSWEKDLTSVPENSAYVVKMISIEDHLAWLEVNLQKHPEQSFVNHFERACIYATIGDAVNRDKEINDFCYKNTDKAKQKDLFAFHEWLEKYDSNTRNAVRMKMYAPEHLQRLFSTYPVGNEFRQKYQSYILDTKTLKPDSAILLLENENDPALFFHALKELAKRRDQRLLNMLTKMMEAGQLSDADAIKLISVEESHFLAELDASEPNLINLRLLSGLLRDKDDNLNALSADKILTLAKAELDPQTVKKYLQILIKREDKNGLELAMELFQIARLRGDEVTELLGVNPKFSSRILSSAPYNHVFATQLSELAQKYPLETGHVLPGMYVKIRAGWCRIDSITDDGGNKLLHTSQGNREVRFSVTLHPQTSYSIQAEINMREKKLNLWSFARQYYRCGRCGFVAAKQDIVVREHTREAHGGIGAYVTPIPNSVQLGDELKFRKSLSE